MLSSSTKHSKSLRCQNIQSSWSGPGQDWFGGSLDLGCCRSAPGSELGGSSRTPYITYFTHFTIFRFFLTIVILEILMGKNKLERQNICIFGSSWKLEVLKRLINEYKKH